MKDKLTYKDAGVDINAGDALVNNIKPFVKATHRPGVIGGLGGFASLFELPVDRYHKPVLVSCTDGVGTKLKLAQDLGMLTGLGIDLVAMCVNDLIVCGGEPLFFLDYYACGKLNVLEATQLIKGISTGLQESNCALVGGETAEMPGLYAGNDFDLAGFCVGVVEKEEIIDGSTVSVGDAVIALGSSGPHSNGYSLIRKIIEKNKPHMAMNLHSNLTLADALMAPTKIYVRSILSLIQNVEVKALAHITGGGMLENIPRVLPEDLAVTLKKDSYTWPIIFQWLQSAGNIDEHEMLRTFNCGVGMIIIVPRDKANDTIAHCKAQGEDAWLIGEVTRAKDDEQVVFL